MTYVNRILLISYIAIGIGWTKINNNINNIYATLHNLNVVTFNVLFVVFWTN